MAIRGDRRGRAMLLMTGAMLFACGGTRAPRMTPPKASASQRYRPTWLASIDASPDAMAACLGPREAPAYVVHLHYTADGLAVVTTVDAFDALERCVVDAGEVKLRAPCAERLSDFAGHPVFHLGVQPPRLPVGQRAEEVTRGGQVLGWIFWPARAAPQLEDQDEEEQ